MTSSKTPKTPEVFKQSAYNNTFYFCEEDHVFIAFTTCYCPLCAAEEQLFEIETDCLSVEASLDELDETYCKLIAKVSATNPELLI